MKKPRFREVEIIGYGRRKVKVKVLETPTLLRELYKSNVLGITEYMKRLNIYNTAIHNKNQLPEVNDTSELQLRNYQKAIVDYAKSFNSFAIFDEPRLGKTPTTIRLIKEKGLIDSKIVVAAPSKTVSGWIKEFKIWSGRTGRKFDGGIKITDKILVMTYERVRRSLKELQDWKPDVFVLDEAHVLRNSRGKSQRKTEKQQEIEKETGLIPRNQSILNLSNMTQHKVALSGTPSVNSPEDIFAILQFLYPKIFTSYWNFIFYYFETQKGHFGGYEIKGYINEDKEKEFQELLNLVSSNNKQEDKLTWLIQPKIYKKEIELNEFQKELEKTLMEEARIGFHFILLPLEMQTHYQTLVTNPSTLQQIETDNIGAKNEYLMEQLKENTKDNVAIFSTRGRNIESLFEAIKKDKELKEREIFVITGKTTPENTLIIQEKINKMEPKNGIILLATISAVKEGVSFQGLTKAYITNQSFVQVDMQQLFNRLNATSKESQEYFGEKSIEILHTTGTVDDEIQMILDNKLTKTQLVNNYQKILNRIERKKI